MTWAWRRRGDGSSFPGQVCAADPGLWDPAGGGCAVNVPVHGIRLRIIWQLPDPYPPVQHIQPFGGVDDVDRIDQVARVKVADAHVDPVLPCGPQPHAFQALARIHTGGCTRVCAGEQETQPVRSYCTRIVAPLHHHIGESRLPIPVLLPKVSLIIIPREGDAVLLPRPVAELLGIACGAPLSKVKAAERAPGCLAQEADVRGDQREAVRRDVREGVQQGVLHPRVDPRAEDVRGVEIDGLVTLVLHIHDLVRSGVPAKEGAYSAIVICL